MRTNISKLTTAHLDAVDKLMKSHSGTIGFLPWDALDDYLLKECVLGATDPDDRLVGYLLYAAYPDRFRIRQLCVAEDFRGQGIAKSLLDALKSYATTQKSIRLECRNDFPAHSIWPRLGFVSIGERPGRSRQGHLLTAWRLALELEDELALFRAKISDDILDVVIDAQIFFDFDRPDDPVTLPSKALVSDLFADSVNLWFTEELFNEIGRNPSVDERDEARKRTGQFLELKHDPLVLEDFEQLLRQVLPSSNPSRLSDINHLAKAAASDVNIFVTRDRGLLNRAEQIAELVNLSVMSPTALILRLGELAGTQTAMPDRVSGLSLVWRRLASNEFTNFPFARFLNPGERLGQLRETVDTVVAGPTCHELDVLWSGNEPLALRGIIFGAEGTLTVSLCRIAATSHDRVLLGRFMLSDLVYKAIRNNLEMVEIDSSTLPTSLLHGLSEMGFTKYDGRFVRFCFTRYLGREEALARVAGLSQQVVNDYRTMSHLELERSCSPLVSDADQNHFLIPIRPGYALNLFDRQQSSRDLFGGDPDVLMNWSNAYYRKATLRHMLRPPGRILWYVSREKKVVAVSHLDDVAIDTPKELFRRFAKYGTLEWQSLYEMCERDVSKKLMALQFSHTFSFRRDVPLDEVRRVFDEDGVGQSFQSPRKIPLTTFGKLFQLGYPEQS